MHVHKLQRNSGWIIAALTSVFAIARGLLAEVTPSTASERIRSPIVEQKAGPVATAKTFANDNAGAVSRAAEPASGEQSGLGAASQPETWTQWRGPTRDGTLANVAAWPEKLSERVLRLSWRTPKLGPSYSGPIVSAERVFTTATEQGKNEVVLAFDRAGGKELWRASWPGALNVPFFAASNGSWIRATPASDGESLFVPGMRDVLVCLNTATGEERWRIDFVEQFKAELPAFGFVSSPLVVGEHVYVQAGGAFCKLDKQTGKALWRTLADGGGMMGSAFGSPVLATLAGREQLVVQMREVLAGVEPQAGQVLWQTKIDAFRGMNIYTPVIHNGEAIFTSAYGGRSELRKFAAQSNELSPSVVWTEKSQGYMSTPLIIKDHLYVHLRNQRFCCLELASGKVCWTTKPFGKYWSLVANGDKILALDERGELLLIRANPARFELLDQRKVSDASTWAHLAVCGTEIFIRDLETLTAWQWSD
jgi:outer membrane protein assembly factor BamB